MEHTQKPYTYHPANEPEGDIIIKDQYGICHIAAVKCDRSINWSDGDLEINEDEQKANALLFLAAPYMLEALKEMMRGNELDINDKWGKVVLPSSQSLYKALSAIKKAEGRE